MKTRLFYPRSGMALVIGLICVVIATILVVGFTVSMRLERQASGAMANNGRAEIIAQNAIEHAIALLDNNIPQPIPPGQTGVPQNWMVSPGLLTKHSTADGAASVKIPLSTNTGAVPSVAPTTDYVNLNASLNGIASGPGADFPIIATGDEVRANWAYVLQDPTQPASVSNPIVGRYAFWMDDENARININTAYGKPSNLRLDRSNPLDQTTDSSPGATNTWHGSPTFQDAIGFNSLIGSEYAVTGSDGVVYIQNYEYSPGYMQGQPSPYYYAPGSGNSNVIGIATGSGASQVDSRRFYPVWHPSAVNLDVLGAPFDNITSTNANPSARDKLANWVFNKTANATSSSPPVQSWRLLQSPEQIKQFVSSNADDFYKANKFNLTAYNRAPEFNAFGKPRLFMEERINSKSTVPDGTNGSGVSDPNYNAYQQNSSQPRGIASGTELAFYQTPDLDPMGPTYFHGVENNVSGTSNRYCTDQSAVQMVGDYLSSILNRDDWPGMPAKSFVDKWRSQSPGFTDEEAKREADQVAWNIVSLGNTAPGIENAFSLPQSYWAPNNALLARTINYSGERGADTDGIFSPYSSLVSDQALTSTTANLDPNLSLRVGKLSGKAIMPYIPRAMASEVVLKMEAVPMDIADPDKGFGLKLSLQVELYTGKRGTVPAYHPGNPSQKPVFVVTHFFYTADGTDAAAPNLPVTTIQGATGSVSTTGDGGATNGYGSTYKGKNSNAGNVLTPFSNALQGSFPIPSNLTNTLPLDRFINLDTEAGKAIFIAQPNAAPNVAPDYKFLTDPNPHPSPYVAPSSAQAFKPDSTVRIRVKARLAIGSGGTQRTYQLIPVWDRVDTNKPPLQPPAGQQDSISWDFNVQLPATGTATFTRSLEIQDPRLGGNTHDPNGNPLWKPNPNWIPFPDITTASTTFADSMGGENESGTFDPETYNYIDLQACGMARGFYINSPRPSIGFLSCVPTGMQRGIPNSVLTFGPSTNKADLPDWLLLDLLAPIFPDMAQPSVAPYSYQHSTMGKMNINAKIYPDPGMDRTLPLQALFKNMVPGGQLAGLVNNIVNHNLAGEDFGAQEFYDYIGELCEVAGVADSGGTDWQKMTLIRNLANLITTQSNTFRLFGVAQTFRKKPGNTGAAFEAGDVITGEKKFECTIERGVWPGIDGVPGNANVNNSGVYDQKSKDSTPSNPSPGPYPWAAVAISATAASSSRVPGTGAQWAQFDGPDDPNARMDDTKPDKYYPPHPGWYGTSSQPLQYTSSILKDARNPARAHMFYKPVEFKYLSE